MIRKLPKKPKREGRFRSQRHRAWVRDHACVVCDSEGPIECAHVRLGSHTGMGQKPDDWRCVPLCGGPEGCHQKQHTMGEETFWRKAKKEPQLFIEALIRTSPVRREIEAHREGNG
jgi:hypothetical protein